MASEGQGVQQPALSLRVRVRGSPVTFVKSISRGLILCEINSYPRQAIVPIQRWCSVRRCRDVNAKHLTRGLFFATMIATTNNFFSRCDRLFHIRVKFLVLYEQSDDSFWRGNLSTTGG